MPTIHAACNDTGWYTIIDLDGARIEPCRDCNPDGVAVPRPEPTGELRTQILVAVHNEMNESKRFARGLLVGLAISVPFWIVVISIWLVLR